MMLYRRFHEFYVKNLFSDCLSAVEQALSAIPDTSELYHRLLALKAWCLYRQNDFGNAEQIASSSNDKWARECLMYIAAYFHKDDAKVRLLLPADLSQLSVNERNAITIRAAHDDSQLANHDDVLQYVSNIDAETTEVANLLNNAGLYFATKKRSGLAEINPDDLRMALLLYQSAKETYVAAAEANYHHLGSLHQRMTNALRSLNQVPEAWGTIKESIKWFDQALEGDPNNKTFAEKCARNCVLAGQLAQQLYAMP